MMLVAVAVALLLVIGNARSSAAAAVVAAIGVGGVFVGVIVAAVIVMVVAARRGAARQRAVAGTGHDELTALDLVAIGVAGGASVPRAIEIARSAVGDALGADLDDIVRHRSAGIDHEPRHVGMQSLIAAIRRSEAMGTTLAPELIAIAASARAERDAMARERLARLPVKLLFPLALLILPGFMLVTVGPVVLSSLLRLTQG